MSKKSARPRHATRRAVIGGRRLPRPKRTPRGRWLPRLPRAGLVFAVARALVAGRSNRRRQTTLGRRPLQSGRPGRPPMSPADECLGCHQAQAAQWQQSHHAQAMAAPTAQLGPRRLQRRRVHAPGRDFAFLQARRCFSRPHRRARRQARRLRDRVHVRRRALAAIPVAMPGGRLQPLQIAWDVPGKKWFRLLPDERRRPATSCTGPGATRPPTRCASNATRRRSRSATTPIADTFASRWAEPNVSCQSCHGPGARHVQWARDKSEGNGEAPRAEADERYRA